MLKRQLDDLSPHTADHIVKAMGMWGVFKSKVSRLREEIDERMNAYCSGPTKRMTAETEQSP